MIDDTDKGSKSSKFSSREQVHTLSVVYCTEGRICSEDLHDLHDGIKNLESKG